MDRLRSTGRRFPDRGRGQAGFSLSEPMVLLLMLTVAMLAAASIFSSAMRSFTTSRNVSSMEIAIDQNISEIKKIAREFTCCSGSCTTTVPADVGPGQACATQDSRDDRYYFPQLDLSSTTTNFPNTTTSMEPAAVDQICSVANNTHFMTPFKTAVDSTPAASTTTRTTTIKTDSIHTLEVTYSDAGRVIRSLVVVPVMANYCP
jgi:Tfp pilus assembly protein PilV